MTPSVSIFLATLVVVAWGRPLVLSGLRALHILQLEEYQTARYWRWIVGHLASAIDGPFLVTIALVTVLSIVLPGPVWIIAPIAGAVVGGRQTLWLKRPEAKKPLVLTARARRLLVGWIVCSVAVGALVFFLLVRLSAFRSAVPFPAMIVGLLVVGLLCWPLMSLANLILFPVEAGFRAYYLGSAQRVLRRYHPVVIGVAGSYGKTSTKSILAQILSTRHPALATPRSFNTPMGLCRVIREQLQPDHRYFVAELGAYRRGEIRQLGKLVHPTIGILTAVGPEHLERFGSMENVVKAEFEIVEALPADGLAIFNGEDPVCRELAAKSKCRYVFAGGPPDPRREIWAEDVELTSAGLRFTLCLADERQAKITTRLLGRHNVANILAASAAALRCGLDLDDLIDAIPKLEPVEHRLQLIPNENGVVVIDDTYNSNPRGAATALETLAAFQGGRRYLVTPGMVELADLQESAHREFGRQAAAVCDGVILVGPKQTRAIAEGLIEAGFSRDRLIVTRNLTEATERLRTLLQGGDAVLFENDLPDNYDE
jgi:UDP-N-acetylmuramoyl-tripeptide--D-alanyl-D-alanine ligase